MPVSDWSNVLQVLGSLSQQEADQLHWAQIDNPALLADVQMMAAQRRAPAQTPFAWQHV